MTTLVAVSQRVDIEPRHGERRDALDQRWAIFLGTCGLTPMPMPNAPAAVEAVLAAAPVRGLLLTGGNDIGDAPERDETEARAMGWARARGLPVIGVCRGMQVILRAFDVALQRVEGHAGTAHMLDTGRQVNSFHHFAATGGAGRLAVLARSADGVIEAVRHPVEPVHGIMWHPERSARPEADDVALFRTVFLEAGE